MTKLAQTLGLTEFQTEILATVRQFVDKEIIPNARNSSTPTPTRRPSSTRCARWVWSADDSEEFGGLGDLLTYALCVEDCPRLDERFRRAQDRLHRGLHAAPARNRRAEARFLPRMAIGETRGAFSMSEPERFRCRRDPHPGRAQRRQQLLDRRSEDVAHQRRQFDVGGGVGANRRRSRQTVLQPHRIPGREANGLRRSRAGTG